MKGAKKRNLYLYFTVAMAGMVTLAVEFTAGRMVQTVYGTSNIVWANVIGLVLLSLTLGYFIGGRWSDRRPEPLVFYRLVAATGVLTVFFLLLTTRLLGWSAGNLAAFELGPLFGSLALIGMALVVPVTLLGCLSPFAIRLAVRDVAEAGRVSGRIYAVSTLGSLLGTYLPVLFTIPLAGTRATAMIFGILLFVVGVGGVGLHKGGALRLLLLPLPFLGAVAWLTAGNSHSAAGQIFQTQSAYNYIQVVEKDGCRTLLLNEGIGQHSFFCPDGRVLPGSIWMMMAGAPLFRENGAAESMAIIGLAGGTIPKLYTQIYGPIPIDGIELDPAIIAVGRDYFGMTEPNIEAIVGDGRYQLRALGSYDVLLIDAYRVPYIPWHLTTHEFFAETASHLNDDGVLAINVGRTDTDRRLVETLTATLLTVYPTVHTVDLDASFNTMLVATMDGQSSLLALEALVGRDALLVDSAERMHSGLVASDVGENIVLTDDRAPVEAIVDSLTLRYLLDANFELSDE